MLFSPKIHVYERLKRTEMSTSANLKFNGFRAYEMHVPNLYRLHANAVYCHTGTLPGNHVLVLTLTLINIGITFQSIFVQIYIRHTTYNFARAFGHINVLHVPHKTINWHWCNIMQFRYETFRVTEED